MCGRAYETYTEEELYLRYLSEKRKRTPLKGFKNTFNLPPSQDSPVVIDEDGAPQIKMLRWGLVPSWAKDVKSASKYSLINARAEEIDEKRSFKEAFKKRRCLVPVSGFYEWKREEGKIKRPFAIRLKDHSIMSIAGVWEYWESKETHKVVESFAMVTCRANTIMEGIHGRMPVILGKNEESIWLDCKEQNPKLLKDILKPCPSEWLEVFEVSTLVNSPKNDSPEVLNPI